jgi:hypothetical protein
MSSDLIVSGSAEFTALNGWQLRPRLDRWWSEEPRALVCMANPSYAGADKNDPTVHWLIKVCRRIPGIGGFTVVNDEPYIATDPRDLERWRDGARWNHPEAYKRLRTANLDLIERLSREAPIRFAAWGNLVQPRRDLLDALTGGGRWPLYAFHLTGAGVPKHPMARGTHRIPNDAEPIIWRTALTQEPTDAVQS